MFHCSGQNGASGYCNSTVLYVILLRLTTGMPLKSTVMSRVVCVCVRVFVHVLYVCTFQNEVRRLKTFALSVSFSVSGIVE